MRIILAALLLLAGFCFAQDAKPDAKQDAKPRVAVFPMAGDAAEQVRERAAFSLRAKLDRTGKFDVIDHHRMNDAVSDSKTPISLDTPADSIRQIAKDLDAPDPHLGQRQRRKR